MEKSAVSSRNVEITVAVPDDLIDVLAERVSERVGRQLLDALAGRRPSDDPAESSRYITLPNAAKLAQCNERTIRYAISNGELSGFRPAHKWLFRLSDVVAWIESRDQPDSTQR